MKEPNFNLTQKAIKATKYSILFRPMAQIVAGMSLIALVRLLSEHDYGVYNLLYSLIALLGMVLSLGINNTLQRFIPEYYARGEFVLANNLFWCASLFRLISNVVFLGIVLLLWEYMGPLFKITDYKNYFLLFTLIILLHMQRGILETCLNSYFLQKYSQSLSVVFVLIKGVGYGIALLLQLDLWIVLLIDLLAYVSVFALLQVICLKKIPRQGGKNRNFPAEEKKRLKRYAFFYNFNDAGVGMLASNFDNFILVIFLNPVAVGGYAFCHRLMGMTVRLLPFNYLFDVIGPLFFMSNSGGETEQTRKNFQLLIKIAYIFSFPLFLLFLLLSEELVRIAFGGKFIEYSPILIGLSFFELVNAFAIPVNLVAQLQERADVILYSKIFAFYNLLADIIFIQFWGIWGAVLATGTAVLAKNLYIWFFVRQEANFSGMGQFFVRMIGGWLLVAGLWYTVKPFINNDLLRFIIGTTFIILGLRFIQLRFVHLNSWEKKMLVDLGTAHKKIGFLFQWSGLSAAISKK